MCRERRVQHVLSPYSHRPRDEEGLKDEQIKQLKQKVGELVLDIDMLKEAMRGRPFGPRTSDE
jgi:hypothetical protein